MNKIPTLFLRDAEDRRFVLPRVSPGCEWVLAGEGTATRKYDGTCVLFDPILSVGGLSVVGAPLSAIPELQGWWARREVKPNAIAPLEYVPIGFDENTGKTVGWEPADRSPFAKFLTEAVRNLTDGPREGTHELIGPKVNRDPERVGKHVVVAHADADVLDDVPRDFEGLPRWLHAHPYEGVVWHHPDGRMAKIKRKDVRRG